MNIGRIEYVDLRELWQHEAHDFTPFLVQNLDLLGQTLNMDLVLLEKEYAVGEFSLDILAEETEEGHKVCIENQLEQTNHRHLGQVLTYMAGVNAHYGVWLVKSFREEHRAVLDWLNHNTAEDIGFFGIEVQAIKIGDSTPAPHFKLVSAPNEWGKANKVERSEDEDDDDDYHSFIRTLHQELSRSGTIKHKVRRVAKGVYNYKTPIRGANLRIRLLNDDRLHVAVVLLRRRDMEWGSRVYALLEPQRAEIISELSEYALEWESGAALTARTQAPRIRTVYNGVVDFDDTDELLNWCKEAITRFNEVIVSRIAKFTGL